jgi:DNA-binding IclR family transcriptional regulator
MPVTPTPSVVRAARLLAALADHPDEDVSLSHLARRLDINKTSCQSLLLALVSEGLVTKGADRRYRLGSGLVHLGEAAKASLRIPELVTPELDTLSAEFGVTAISGVKDRGDVVLVAVSEVSDPLGLSVRLGQRLPLRAPLGPIYLAWESTDAIESWLDRAQPTEEQDERDQARATLDRVRRRACSITVRRDTPGASGAGSPRSRSRSAEYPECPDPSRTWSVLGIAAPVFGAGGELLCSMALTAFPYQIGDAEITHIADRVRAVASAVTDRLVGAPR